MKNIPLSTYRLQFNPAFGFTDAEQIVSYLSALGISCIYASPVFMARKGSTHGYDIIDPNRVNPELGSEEEFHRLLEEVNRQGISWLQDIVPNHMAYDMQNEMMIDVLENGPNSRYFLFFDVEWDHPQEGIRGRVLAPFLGRYLGEAIENGELGLHYNENGFAVHYYDLAFPIKIESYAAIVAHRLGVLRGKLDRNHPDFVKLMGVLGVLYVLKTFIAGEPTLDRYDQINFVKVMLWELYTQNADFKDFLDENLNVFNGTPGDPKTLRHLERLLHEQFYRLSYWKVATEEINYRRFFNINGLISLRMEDPKVFDQTHAFILRLVREGKISGLRIDHVDGLFDPTLYLRNIHRETEQAYIVVEKILAYEEEIPDFWPVHGTTGYDFLNYVNGIFCEQRNEKIFDTIYGRFTGFNISFEDLVFEKKNFIAEKHMAGDVDNLAHVIKNISRRFRTGSDITLHGLRRAIMHIMANLPVYRSYLSREFFRSEDRLYINLAVNKSKVRNPDSFYELSFLEELLLPEFVGRLSAEVNTEWIKAVMRFQQFTGPLTAKGVEDTALYIYNRLISLNEVGGYPDRFGISVESFHKYNSNSAQRHPNSMNATCTHDTKRGEDVRARINVLSEIPHEWERALKTWSNVNGKYKRTVGGKRIPDANDEYFLYQTLVGAFPFHEHEIPRFLVRMKEYVVKSAREAKTHTSWLRPNSEYEDALTSFTESILNEKNTPFLKAFLPFQRKIASFGMWNSLSQVLLKMVSPGVPDFYQGTELWDLNLVDPDNRRPVDFKLRQEYLSGMIKQAGDLLSLSKELLATWEDGRIKLFIIHRALMIAKKNPTLFQMGEYIALVSRGACHNHVVALARRHEHSWAIAVVPRLLTRLVSPSAYPLGEEIWRNTHLLLPKGAPLSWTNVLTGERIDVGTKKLPVGELLMNFPVALLVDSQCA
ncbi:MAG: malto-oligosyltrehalose synthase [Syntrophobacteraceae bacterium]